MTGLRHATLNATLLGHESEYMTHFRGLRYARIARRFEIPQIINDWSQRTVDCRRFGPRCPQIKIDAGYLLRESEGNIWFEGTEDEFECTNLDVAVPKAKGRDEHLPVLVWIHGGSQVVSYGSGPSKIGDVRRLVARSVEMGRPMIVVSVQYRLNIFHVGDTPDRKNFGLKDLQCALDWVRRHIGGFGGDCDNITLAGESAGAALCHALVVTGARARRAILMSGSLYMSSPRPEGWADSAVRQPILAQLDTPGITLTSATTAQLVTAQSKIPLMSVGLQVSPELEEWKSKTGNVQELMIGDCEFESVLWRSAFEKLDPAEIDSAFARGGQSAAILKTLYHIDAGRPTSCRIGVLDFANDLFWTLPTRLLADLFRTDGKHTFKYLIDQANPWQPSARAHHAVDLLYLFGGFEMSPTANRLGSEMMTKFISFVNGVPPWREERWCAFGPHGLVTELEEEEARQRRRSESIDVLQNLPLEDMMAVLAVLMPGRISLHN